MAAHDGIWPAENQGPLTPPPLPFNGHSAGYIYCMCNNTETTLGGSVKQASQGVLPACQGGICNEMEHSCLQTVVNNELKSTLIWMTIKLKVVTTSCSVGVLLFIFHCTGCYPVSTSTPSLLLHFASADTYSSSTLTLQTIVIATSFTLRPVCTRFSHVAGYC